MAWLVTRLVRYPISTAIVALSLTAVAGIFVFARPQYRPHTGTTITLPEKQPAADAVGAAGWVWPEGLPGWEPGYTIKDYNVSGLQPVEVQQAQLAAARQVLDASRVRVIASSRGSLNGVLAILAAPTMYQTPEKTCLAALLEGDAPVQWQCPGTTPATTDLSHSRVLVAATSYETTAEDGRNPLYMVGVARGDVYRVVLDAPGLAPRTIYTRGTNWGQFDAALTVPTANAELKIFGRQGLLQTVPFMIRPGQQRVIQ
jgi:hypothetical protein